jgi:hypothetical protein
MNNKKIISGVIILLSCLTTSAQEKDTIKTLKEVILTGYKTVNGVGRSFYDGLTAKF